MEALPKLGGESGSCYIPEACDSRVPFSNHWDEFTGQITVRVNFHFIRTGDHGKNFGRKHANKPGDPFDDTYNGYYIAQQFVDLINNNHATNMPAYLQHRDANGNELTPSIARLDTEGNSIPNLVDSKIRLELYTDPANTQDTFDGVWYHHLDSINWRCGNDEATDSTCTASTFGRCGIRNTIPLQSWKNQYSAYGEDVLDIFIFDEHWNCDGCYLVRGRALSPDKGAFAMANIWYTYFNNNSSPFSNAGTLWHELGHMLSLGHTFEGGPCCQANEKELKHPVNHKVWNNTNNVMGYNASQSFYAPCQLDQIFNFAYKEMGNTIQWASISGNFDDIASFPSTPLDTIFVDTIEVWNTPRVIHGIVFVKPGGRLFIENTTIRFSEPSLIQVDRGALLQVEKAKLTRSCGDQSFWSGIRVAGNTSRNHPDFYDDDFNPDNQDPGRVVLLDEAVIESARWAIITEYKFQYRPDYWGGYIHCNGAEFKDCHRAAAFMMYRKPNKSSFYNTKIRSAHVNHTPQYAGSTGVSIWATHGISFVNCQFSFLDVYGIFTIDGSFVVESSNSFSNIRGQGVHISRSSQPIPAGAIVKIGDLNHSEGLINKFTGNFNHVRISEYGGLKYSAQIYLNEFDGGFSDTTPQNHNTSIIADGEPSIDVTRNKFTNNYNVISVHQTWDKQNLILDNHITRTHTGIWYKGISPKAWFACNSFNEYQKAAVNVEGIINESQGTTDRSPANYWQRMSGNGTDIFVKGREVIIDPRSGGANPAFKYYYKPDTLGLNSPFRPRCNLTDQTEIILCAQFHNYTTPPASLNRDCDIYENIHDDGEEMELDLATLRYKTDSIISNVLDYQSDSLYLKLKYAKDVKIEDSLRVLLQNVQYSTADALIAVETDTRHKRMRYSLKLEQDDYSGASTLLNALPSTDEDDADFYDIQVINLKRLSIPEYQPDSTEWETLEEIAVKSSSSGAYAKAIITYYDARSWDTDFPEYPEDTTAQRPLTIEETAEDVVLDDWKLYPNPTNGRIMIELEGGVRDKFLIQVHTILGSILYSKEFIPTGNSTMQELDLSSLSPGLYFVSLNRIGKHSRTLPLFIQK